MFQAVLSDADPTGNPTAIRFRFNFHQHRREDAKLEEDPALERDGHTN